MSSLPPTNLEDLLTNINDRTSVSFEMFALTWMYVLMLFPPTLFWHFETHDSTQGRLWDDGTENIEIWIMTEAIWLRPYTWWQTRYRSFFRDFYWSPYSHWPIYIYIYICKSSHQKSLDLFCRLFNSLKNVRALQTALLSWLSVGSHAGLEHD